MRVTQFLACVDAEKFPPEVPSRHVLRGVGAVYLLPSGIAFPVALPRVTLFTRFTDGIGAHRFMIRMIWHRDADTRILIRKRKLIPIEFSELERPQDYLVPLKNTRLRGFGVYEFRLTDVEEPRIILAREFIEVRQT